MMFSKSRILIPFVAVILLLGGCVTSSKIKTGDQAFQQKAYFIATTLYKDEYVAAETPLRKAEIAFKVGESYRLTGKTKDAEKWYQEAVRLKYGPEAKLRFGEMLKANGKYDNAIQQFKEYARDEPFKKQLAFDLIKGTQLAQKWAREPDGFSVENMETVNSEASEYAPVFYQNKDIIFTSDRLDAVGEDTYDWTGERFSDLFITGRKDEAVYQGVVPFSEVINSGMNEGTPAFNQGFTEMYFTRCGTQGKADDYCRIYYSFINVNGQWSAPQHIPFFPDTVNVGHPVLAIDGSYLIFSADPPNKSLGGNDLYISQKEYNGWSQPVSLGNSINTEGDELFPYIDEENNLYFASDGHSGMGGLDIFKALPEPKGGWRNVQNLKPPINSSADDFGILMEKLKPTGPEDATRQMGYFTSSRYGGQGKEDIYKFVLSNENIFILDGLVLEKVYADPTDPNSKVIDFKVVENADIDLRKYTIGLKPEAKLISDENGRFEHRLAKETKYRLKADKDGYLNKTLEFSTEGLRDLSKVTIKVKVRVILDKIFEEVEIVLDNIYYDYDKASLRPESEIVLDTLATLLLDNPDIIVEIGSHTDSRGSVEYNEKLSLARAQSVITYLVANKVNIGRLKAKGYGESSPVNECVDGVECTEEQYQENRRTTFKILSEKFNIESIKPDSIRVDPKEEP